MPLSARPRMFEENRPNQTPPAPTAWSLDRGQIEAILDEGHVCHVGFLFDGFPVVIPMLYTRSDDGVYIHGSTANRMFRMLTSGTDMCRTVTLLDGLVLARSSFNHSANYRSVVVFGRRLASKTIL
jgi:uncharacterized protein